MPRWVPARMGPRPGGDAPGVNVALVGGEEVAAVVERHRAVPFDALPHHGVGADGLEQRDP